MVKIGDIVKVVWLDISHLDEDIPEKKALELEPCVMTSYGRVISHSADLLRIIGNECNDPDDGITYRDCTALPTSVVQSITVLQEISSQ